jgi:UDP-glucose 6-dehydrogenase
LERPRIGAAGAGYVGLATGPSLSHVGARVVGLEEDEERDAYLEELAAGAGDR